MVSVSSEYRSSVKLTVGVRPTGSVTVYGPPLYVLESEN